MSVNLTDFTKILTNTGIDAYFLALEMSEALLSYNIEKTKGVFYGIKDIGIDVSSLRNIADIDSNLANSQLKGIIAGLTGSDYFMRITFTLSSTHLCSM